MGVSSFQKVKAAFSMRHSFSGLLISAFWRNVCIAQIQLWNTEWKGLCTTGVSRACNRLRYTVTLHEGGETVQNFSMFLSIFQHGTLFCWISPVMTWMHHTLESPGVKAVYPRDPRKHETEITVYPRTLSGGKWVCQGPVSASRAARRGKYQERW